ncbi:unnamed protein product [Acanthoscelides obtectus]|uniref:Uncharacterized protein n=1 Tax=Acanthoscelides obtectus TaxID=200917 RepID=A0A9P0LFV4_ACAOB|nr:unnamed protein product [Acanthoscelides obtectus]CAK1643833.1 hypothetical protein AOBTE_LOCUS13695 [Acanthoscelides obtectus]
MSSLAPNTLASLCSIKCRGSPGESSRWETIAAAHRIFVARDVTTLPHFSDVISTSHPAHVAPLQSAVWFGSKKWQHVFVPGKECRSTIEKNKQLEREAI